MDGVHLVGDLHDCRIDFATEAHGELLRDAIIEECRAAGLTVVQHCFFQFPGEGPPYGVTGVVLLAESHVAVHTWPELRSVTIDIYVCNFSRDNSTSGRQVFDRLLERFKSGRSYCRTIRRGATIDPSPPTQLLRPSAFGGEKQGMALASTQQDE
jgi:S-adenosylmethionine decarboxylase proenzyme